MCVGFLYTLTCMRPRTLVVVVSKKESLEAGVHVKAVLT